MMNARRAPQVPLKMAQPETVMKEQHAKKMVWNDRHVMPVV